jgi:UDP-3-O-[3-hydroxymyristoyl] glucosamine N-acyltransferase
MEWAPLTADPRFFERAGPFSVAAVADAAEAEAPPRRLMLHGVAPLQTAGENEVSFLDNRKYLPALLATRAAAVLVHPDLSAKVPASAVPIVTTEPYAAWARVAALFHPIPPPAPGVHPSAVISPDARVHPTAEVGPLAVIDAAAEIGPRCRIGALAVIGRGVVLGADCRIGPHAALSHALVGDRVYIYPGARIGQDGFGFAVTSEGFRTVPQLGRVVIEDDVEVGANSTIDRGSLHDTVIGAGTRIDNLVMIGHNVQLGRACVVVAQVGVSGSTIVGDQVVIAGQAGLTGHLKIGARSRIGAQAGVMADVDAGADVVGSPAQPVKAFFRELATLRRMARERSNAKRPSAAGSESGSN